MPICTHIGLYKYAIATDKSETFQDHEEVFYCETTREIFRDYEDYFRHVMAINSTIWRCEMTGKENLTYEEAARSERNARRKLNTFKEILRPPTLLLIENAQQTSLRNLCALAHRFLRSRFFRNEEVQVYQRTQSISSSYHYVVTDIIWPFSETPDDDIYLQPEKLRYRLRCLEENSNVGESLVVPFDKLRRDRSGMSWDNLYIFIKNHTIRVNGILEVAPEFMKKYITDCGLTFEKMFIGKMMTFPAPKLRAKNSMSSIPNLNNNNNQNTKSIKKQSNNNTSPIINQTNDKKNIQNTTLEQNNVNRDKEIKKEQELAKVKSLKDEMERIRQQKLQQILEQERIKAAKREELLAEVEKQCDALLLSTDDLERTDQRVLPVYNPIRCYIPTKFLGDAFAVREFMHNYSGILSGIEVFRGNLSFYELSRAFTVREVAGPLSDIFCVLLGSIFEFQREEDEECYVEYVTGMLGNGIQEPYTTMTLAARAHHYCKRHFASKLNELPVDALTLSEVLRLHLLSSGALIRNRRAEKWRLMYRNGYSSSEDPGLELRMQSPHILKALKIYTIYQLPYRDIICVIRCLINQLLTYSGTINQLEERLEQINTSRQELKNITILENQRLTKLQAEKRSFTNEFHQQCMDDKFKNDKDKRQNLEEKFNKKIAELLATSDREHKKHQTQVAKINGVLFNHLTYLGMDRAYRKYYIWESLPGIFIEHPKECYDMCLTDPPKNDPENLRFLPDADKLPQNRKDLRTYLMKKYQENEKQKISSTVQQTNDKIKIVETGINNSVKDEESKENKENCLNGQLNHSVTNGYDSTSQHSNNFNHIEEIESSNNTNSTTINIRRKSMINNNDKLTEEEKLLEQKHPTQYQLYMCTGDSKNCIVHDKNNPDRQLWSYIYRKEELDALIESLNTLGNRESELRNQLITYKDHLLRHIRNCPVDMINVDNKQISRYKRIMMLETNRKYQNANFGKTGDKIDLNNVMFTALSDRILQFERDLYMGSLGVLKVKNMDKWRDDLQAGLYDPQVKIQWGVLKAVNSNNIENHESRLSDESGSNSRDQTDNEPEGIGAGQNGQEDEAIQYAGKAYHDPGEYLTDTLLIDSEEGSSDEDNIYLHNTDAHRVSVKQLASALLQVEQAVERRFMKEPFGTALLKDREQQERKQQMANNRLRQWEVSLMESTSFSQIFLHLNVLHDSIIWARSTTKSNCMVCRRGSDPDKLLLCDECNGGTHMFCMKPKLDTVPAGNWYCKRCIAQFGMKNDIDLETKISKDVKHKRAFLIDDENSDTSSVTSNEIKRTRSGVGRSHANSSVVSQTLVGGRRSRRLLTQENTTDTRVEVNDVSNDSDNEKPDESDSDKQEDQDEDDTEAMRNNNYKEDDDNENHIEEEESVSDEDMKSEEELTIVSDEEDDKKNDDEVEDKDMEEKLQLSDDFEYEQNSDANKSNTKKTEKHSSFEVKLKRSRGNNKRRLRNISKNDQSENNEESSDEAQKFTTPAKRPRRSAVMQLMEGEENISSGSSISSRRSQRRSNSNLPLDNKVLQELLGKIVKEDNSWPFLRPVSQAEVPDYYKIIKKPMDFAKIKSNLNVGAYANNGEVLHDIELIFKNCDRYNMVGDEIYKAGCALEKCIVDWCKELKLSFRPSDMNASE